MRTARLLPLLLSLIGLPAFSQQAGPAPDFAAARQEAVGILGGLVRINTTNPPGNETQAAQHLQRILGREGIAAEIFEMERGRGNLVARLPGNGLKKPLLLMGHLDVVGVERDQWSVDPFGAVVQGGYLYGRGALDDKGGVSACLETFLLLHRLHVPLDRDVIFLADGDLALLTPEGVRLSDFEGRGVKRPVTHILWDPILAEKGGYKHFMLKEIYEQPRAVRDTILGRVGQESGRIFLEEMDISPREFREFREVKIIACGTSWHAALAGKFMIEKLARMPVEVDYGS